MNRSPHGLPAVSSAGDMACSRSTRRNTERMSMNSTRLGGTYPMDRGLDVRSAQPRYAPALAADARRPIEQRVVRAESSIRTPGTIADMSCTESLHAADVDVCSGAFANVAGFYVHALVDSLSGGLKSGLASATATSGVARATCAQASERFESRSSGLTGSMENIVAGFELPEFACGFGPPMANRTASRPVRSSPAASSAPSRSHA